MSLRECASCGRDLPRSSFSANQYSLGEGRSRCASCIYGHPSDVPTTASSSGRYNISGGASVQPSALNNPIGEGAFRWVAKGTYTEGSRCGQDCAMKWFKTGEVYEDDYFTLDINAVHRALDIVDKFNDQNIVYKTIKVNIPAVWRFTSGHRTGQRILVEPFIQNYEKFNSNTGWNDDSFAWGEVMQALSHFSYHVSGGQFVLCDLQGGVYRDSVVLSDPVILSRNRDYGVTDLGPNGISSFFSQHNCNSYCRPNWSQPANPVRYFDPVPGTTMIRRTVPTRQSRPTYYD